MTGLATVEVACCVCHAQGGTTLARGWDFEYGTTREELPLLRCAGCGHVYLSPRPAESELATIYPPDYYSYDMERSINPIALRAKRFLDRRKARALLRLAPTPAPRCLDVGCGDGRLLDLLAAAGVPPGNLHGVELSERAIARVRERGYHGHLGRIEEVDLPAGSFDFVTLFQVIEHVSDPEATLRALARLLAPGGVLVVETPNVRSLDARLFRRRYWGGYHFPRHWNLFDREGLARLGRGCGLEPVRLETFVCAVFWIYPFHHWLREKGLPRPIYRFFWPASNPLLLAAFTAVDMLLAPLGLSANLRGVFRRP